MSDKGLVALLLIAAGTATAAGVVASQRKTSKTVSPTQNYELNLTGPLSTKTGVDNTYTVTLTNNGSAVPGVSVSIYINGVNSATGTTTSEGKAYFTVKFTNSGTATLYVKYGNIISNKISVDVSSSTAPPSEYTLTLSGPNSGIVGNTLKFNASITNSLRLPVSAQISFYINGNKINTESADLGTAEFITSFENAGTYSIYAIATNISTIGGLNPIGRIADILPDSETSGTSNLSVKSNTITVVISSQTTSPTCSSNSNCPAGSNCINGQCTPLDATAISLPATVSISGYVMTVFGDNDVFYNFTTYESTGSYNPFCPVKTPPSTSKITFFKTITGKVLSGTAGINKASVNITVSKSKLWTGPYNSSGTATLDIEYGDADSNGVFTIQMTLTLEVLTNPSYSPLNLDNSVQFTPQSMDIPIFTLTVESMGITAEVVVSPNIEMYGMRCYYINGGLT